MAESTASPAESKYADEVGQKAKKEPSRASKGFTPWRPAIAEQPIPECERHRGIIPRPNSEAPNVDRPSAHESNGAVLPPLWQDLKGAILVKHGDRFIEGYDQVNYLFIQLMNLRTKGSKPNEQEPKRDPITYICHHGMPYWTNPSALNVANKAIQYQIKKNSHEEPWSNDEREQLATIFREKPDISLLSAAKIFNYRVCPSERQKRGAYPIGRFAESIQHEYRIYKATYNLGQAPVLVATKDTPVTKKDIPLEDLYATWTQEKKNNEKAAKKSAAQTSRDAKKGAETGGNEGSKPRKHKTSAVEKPTGKMSEAAGVKKLPRFRRGQTLTNPFVEMTVLETNTALRTGVIFEPSQAEAAFVVGRVAKMAQAAVENVVVQERFVDKASRSVELDENYDEYDDL
ncbi:uncharacterized protein M421DRAFT_90417 [Didymella exigua CBS 183.55]|uniref:Uncharacterized protein n=1 Tax=Didymella exigua CBS 183.55 TaxID=1150837 RepID=A0A6A5RU36_9PLEO|nr:uncharacterized protein M421DRAFT_90417 [Didymella exigua CBS 183.55]KAF1931352.1 hypothetical protein M421DRAFT_90417 [Didymella exigua CBS 183.55]